MAKKAEIVTYNASKQDVANAMFCIKRGIAFCMKRCIDENVYFVERYDSNNPLIPGEFMKIDPKGAATYANRSKLDCLEAWKTVFKFYEVTRNKLEGNNIPKPVIEETKVDPNDKEKTLSYNPKREKPGKFEDYGVDLFDMIKECEEENAVKATS